MILECSENIGIRSLCLTEKLFLGALFLKDAHFLLYYGSFYGQRTGKIRNRRKCFKLIGDHRQFAVICGPHF